MNKSKINEYKINNNNKTNTKHEFNVKYERYKQDISKDTNLVKEASVCIF
jgi:site-specific DNA-adenine methylase